MSDTVAALLRVDGEVQRPLALTFADLAAVGAEHQIADVSQLDPARRGGAVRLGGLLALAGVRSAARWLTLHAARDNFHASIPLDAVIDRAVVIYRLENGPLPQASGGPVRFFIPDFASCHTAEVDECANVKYVDRIELSEKRGEDSRPADERAHADLHARTEQEEH